MSCDEDAVKRKQCFHLIMSHNFFSRHPPTATASAAIFKLISILFFHTCETATASLCYCCCCSCCYGDSTDVVAAAGDPTAVVAAAIAAGALVVHFSLRSRRNISRRAFPPEIFSRQQTFEPLPTPT